MTLQMARNTFRDLMAKARTGTLTAADKERLMIARQILRRQARPSMNGRKSKRRKRTVTTRTVSTTRTVRNNARRGRFAVYVGAPDGSGNKYFGDASTLPKAKKILQTYTRSHGYTGFIVGAGGKVVYEVRKRAAYTPLSPMRRNKAARNPKGFTTPKRIGNAVELRYDRDIGRHPGFYKHTFSKRRLDVNILPPSKAVKIIGGVLVGGRIVK